MPCEEAPSSKSGGAISVEETLAGEATFPVEVVGDEGVDRSNAEESVRAFA